MKKTLLLGAFAAMLAIPAMQAESVELFVKDASGVRYGSNQSFTKLEELTQGQNNLHALKIGGYEFITESAGTDAKSVRLDYDNQNKYDWDWAVTFRPNVSEQSVTIIPPPGTYMNGVTFVLSPVNNACPSESSYTITDANGAALDGSLTLSGDYNERVTWVGANKSGYKTLRLQYNKTGMSIRTIEYIIETVDTGSASYADLFTLKVPAGAYIPAGVATSRAANTFGNLGCCFKDAAEVNEDCGEKVTLVYSSEVIKSWGANSEEITIDEDTNTVYFDGVTALDVINPGQYTLTIPRGFFKLGDVYANGMVVNYNAAPNVKYSHMAWITEPNSQSSEFNKVKIVNVNLSSEPVITDSFYVFANRKKYYKDSARVEDGAVVVWLENPTSDSGTYYIDLAEGGIAWPLDEGTYCYNNGYEAFQVDIYGPALTIEAESPYGTNNIEVTWTNPTGSFTEGYIRYNNESVALTAAQLASGAQQTATITVEKGNWYDVSMVFYGSGTVESNHETVWAGPAVNIHNPIDFTSEQWYSRRERGTEWIVLPFADFENNQTYEVNVTGRSTESSGYSFLLYIGYTQDTAEMVQYGTFSGLNNAKSNAITLHAEDMVTPGDVYAAAYAEEGQLPVQYGGLFLALCDQDGLSTLLNVHIGRDATGVDTLETAEGVAEYFNMQGVRVANPEKGLYIVRQNGKTSKVLMK